MISCVIPVYQEPNILEFRKRLFRALNRDGMPYQREIIWSIGDVSDFVQLTNVTLVGEKIIYEPDRGLGRALKLGFRAVNPSSEWILTMDSDLQQLPEEIPLLWKFADGRYDIVIGA